MSTQQLDRKYAELIQKANAATSRKDAVWLFHQADKLRRELNHKNRSLKN